MAQKIQFDQRDHGHKNPAYPAWQLRQMFFPQPRRFHLPRVRRERLRAGDREGRRNT